MQPLTSGALILAATPIGSSTDASEALRSTLAEADLIAAEDTRRFVTLTKRLGIEPTGRVVSYFEGNESSRTGELVDAVAAGQKVVLATDAGMPSVSDPGYRAVVACIEAGLRVTAVPGPSAVLTALAVSGLSVDRFCFEGFLPRKSGERSRRLAALAREERTMVFFEAPHRLEAFLRDAATQLGDDRRAAVCRELTKPYEEIRRGGLAELVGWAHDGVRGEVTLVVAGADPQEASVEDALGLVRQRMADGAKLSSAVGEVAKLTGANRKELYAAALADKENQ
ncbi:16S rRNA (cytidine1402-2'-O)-methyltransferase [Tessaracoccus bendigoensis DSM 12906]|uniref:Ribosomal RNA small subunit methyltransferase I n=1 Tax=Tessaracoccus bendigoensis DSM 12906 TaxID=1123357 RepID=A0A1M6MTY7_9ACTN|nr:16S rRNA (cytidine(1402)-2'-O)-methyltransferase [Tessaracoccus bendigoensis]SHJ86882.1 16S rRNA (cytidine1402-2'-O)-methyltransferase [Tessaracoccus bendigoensis DSM 12906]